MSNKYKVMHGAVCSDDYGGDYCAFPPQFYLQVLEALVWGIGTSAGRATEQTKQLTQLIKGLRDDHQL